MRPQEVLFFSRYAEGRACPVSGSISVVNNLTSTHPIETSFERAPKRLDFRAGNLPTSEHQLKCFQKWLYLCLEKLEFQAPSWETLDVVNRPQNAHKQLFPAISALSFRSPLSKMIFKSFVTPVICSLDNNPLSFGNHS